MLTSTEIAAGAADRAVAILASMAEGRWEEARRDFRAIGAPVRGSTGCPNWNVPGGAESIANLLAMTARARLVAGEAMQQAVDQARAGGHSWREIGDVLGTTRHALRSSGSGTPFTRAPERR